MTVLVSLVPSFPVGDNAELLKKGSSVSRGVGSSEGLLECLSRVLRLAEFLRARLPRAVSGDRFQGASPS